MSDQPEPNAPHSLPPAQPTPPAAATPGGLPAEIPVPERGWVAVCHLAAFSGYLTGIGWILGPLIVWLIKRAEMPSVDAQGKEALNFQISVLIYALIVGVLGVLTCGVGFFLLIGLGIFQIVLMILAAIKASNGEPYRYPLTIRLIN